MRGREGRPLLLHHQHLRGEAALLVGMVRSVVLSDAHEALGHDLDLPDHVLVPPRSSGTVGAAVVGAKVTVSWHSVRPSFGSEPS